MVKKWREGMNKTLTWLQGLSPFVKVAAAVGVLLGAGWTGHIAFSQQVGLPALVGRTVERVNVLEERVDFAEEVLSELTLDLGGFHQLEERVDSLYGLQIETYCIVRAHALDMDPFVECTLTQRERDPR